MKFIFSIIFILLSHNIFCQIISGLLIDKHFKSFITNAKVQLTDSLDNPIASHIAYTDNRGIFNIYASGHNSYNIKIVDFFRMYDTILRNIKPQNDTVIYDIQKFCPICQKSDEIEPISSNNGCIVSTAGSHWYCRRDKIKF